MTGVRPPQLGRAAPPKDPLGILQAEIAAEQASSLSRAARRLEEALAALRSASPEGEEHEALLARAGEALWRLAVQREAIGLRNSDQMMRDYGVPKVVRLRMGVTSRR